MAVALFFFSCEDENTLLGFKNPVPKFDVLFVEIPLTSNVQLIDSLSTDNKGRMGAVQVGEYVDMTFGRVRAESYLQISHTAGTAIPDAAELDSVTFQVRYNFYHYGFANSRNFRFSIHELTGDFDRTSTKRHLFRDQISYNPVGMAQTLVTVDPDSLAKQYALTTGQDTLLSTVALNRDFGLKIFNLAKKYTFVAPDTTKDSQQATQAAINEFYQTIKGLAVVPTEANGILGLSILNNFSGVRLHYHTKSNGAVKDTLTRFFAFTTPSFTNINVQRNAPLSGVEAYQNVTELSSSGTRYIQSGNPVITKLDLTNFYNFADTVGSVIINEASIVIGGVETSEETSPIPELGLKAMKPDNHFSDARLPADLTNLDPYLRTGFLVRDGYHYFVSPELPSQMNPIARMRFSGGQYSVFITLFMQQLLKSKDVEVPLSYLGLYPIAPSIAASVNRSVFNAENVKLRIYYTKPTLTTNPN